MDSRNALPSPADLVELACAWHSGRFEYATEPLQEAWRTREVTLTHEGKAVAESGRRFLLTQISRTETPRPYAYLHSVEAGPGPNQVTCRYFEFRSEVRAQYEDAPASPTVELTHVLGYIGHETLSFNGQEFVREGHLGWRLFASTDRNGERPTLDHYIDFGYSTINAVEQKSEKAQVLDAAGRVVLETPASMKVLRRA